MARRIKAREIRIENWAVVQSGDAYTAPEAQVKQLSGQVFGHPRFEDGKQIVTSAIVTLDLSIRICFTKNSVYRLGVPHPDYAQMYPQSEAAHA
jgi:hypothetical protein